MITPNTLFKNCYFLLLSAALSAYENQNRGVTNLALPQSSRPHPSAFQDHCPQVQEGVRRAGSVLVHWTHNGPSMQSAAGNATDDDDDEDDDDDGKLKANNTFTGDWTISASTHVMKGEIVVIRL